MGKEDGENQGELLYVSHLSKRESGVAGDASFNEMEQVVLERNRVGEKIERRGKEAI